MGQATPPNFAYVLLGGSALVIPVAYKGLEELQDFHLRSTAADDLQKCVVSHQDLLSTARVEQDKVMPLLASPLDGRRIAEQPVDGDLSIVGGREALDSVLNFYERTAEREVSLTAGYPFEAWNGRSNH